MKIKSIELVKYKRFNLTKINRLFATFNEKIQIIIGTNGSGKSSLMKELSPLPATSDEYGDSGSKTIIIENKNDIYCLTSTFNSSQKHSFLKNGIEMNLGNTLTVQRELVKKEFGITQEIHDLFTGTIRFHSMSVAQRRHWFTMLSHTDYTYAISVYNKLKEKHRDTQGALKINQARLLAESSKILSIEEENGAREYIAYLKNILQIAKENSKQFYSTAKTPTVTDIKNTARMVNEYSNSLLSNIKYLSSGHNESYKTLDDFLLQYESEKIATEIVIAEKEESYEYNLSIYSSLQAISDTDADVVSKEISDIKNEIESKENNIEYRLDISDSDIYTAIKSLDNVYDMLMHIFKNIPDNSSGKMTKDRYIYVKDKIALLEANLDKVNKSHLEALNSKKNMESDKANNETTCPNCNHTWHRGFIQLDYDELLKYITSLASIVKTDTSELDIFRKDLSEMELYLQNLNEYRALKKNWPILTPLWNLLDQNDILNKNPGNIVNILESFKLSLHVYKDIAEMKTELVKKSELLDILKDNKNKDSISIKSTLECLHENIFEMTEKRRNLEYKIATLKNLKDILAVTENLKTSVANSLDSLSDMKENWIRNETRIYYETIIKKLEETIDREDSILRGIDRQKEVYLSIERQNAALAKEIETLKILMTELSPSEGLIAKGMNRFINVFLQEINSVLATIWSYPLELYILNEETDVGELDYKFALIVDSGEPIKDINKASTAMKEVIDLGFKIVCMKYLGMLDYPIYLDEFGASMDSVHRHGSINTIKDLIQNSNFSQVFLISHYESSYNSFKGADITVLCSNNITIPKDMNFNNNAVLN